ncbi:MAG: ABC transporter ATP-binding protein [Lachnospiraceae bacterium]|nr:ABC transporter ATP-binding protein [Lachnospiraceae bacterium]MCI9399667.1 ABC transporter ATP-binding protein [Lachnospiraceae bacterium]
MGENKEQEQIAIAVQNVCKIYKLYDKPMDRLKEALGLTRNVKHREHFALNNVNFQVKQGECVGIIGTNGSGKSTILKIITGVLNPTSGAVTVNGRISALLELGAGFNQEYSGMENIYLNGTMNGFSNAEIDAKLQDILDFADIGDYVHQPVKTYSSGMFVRLAFSVAINIEPEILIVDEALSVGDVFFQAKCYHKFEEFKKMGKTIMIVSHDLSSIAKYCDRVILLNQGVKLGEGSPKEMIDDFKRVLVGQYELPEQKSEQSLLNDAEVQEAVHTKAAVQKRAREGNAENTKTLEYGTKEAEIEEIYIVDDRGVRTNAILKGMEFGIYMKVRFHQDLPAPIFAFSIKTAKGTEITGTNTMFEKAFLESVSAGSEKLVSFTQKMSLQGGEYLISFGVTGYNGNEFQVYHRLYDALDITVISDKNTVGYYDMNSKVAVCDVHAN